MEKTIKKIQNLDTILVVGAHPDDESFIAGGIMAMASQNGQKVYCVTATTGEKGVYNPKRWPKEQIANIRTEEIKGAMKKLGKINHQFLDYKDGECYKVPESEAISKLDKIIKEKKPDTILTFGDDGLTGHPDHSAVGSWAKKAAVKNKIPVYVAVIDKLAYKNYFKKLDEALDIFFNIELPVLSEETDCDLLFKLPNKVSKKKLESLRAMESQTHKMFELFEDEYLEKAFSTEAFLKAK